jgi:hypothetical protein
MHEPGVVRTVTKHLLGHATRLSSGEADNQITLEDLPLFGDPVALMSYMYTREGVNVNNELAHCVTDHAEM